MMSPATLRTVANFVLFQAGWWVCVGYPGNAAAGIAFGIVVLHLLFISQSPATEFRFIILGTAIGSLLDGLWFRAGILLEPGTQPLWVPLWLVGIWAVFMTTLAHSLSWMGDRRWLPFILAPLAGPLTYWSATRLGEIRFPDPLLSVLALALGWLIIFPLLMYLRNRYFREIVAP